MPYKVNNSKDNRIFGRTAASTHPLNIRGYAKRGGIRL